VEKEIFRGASSAVGRKGGLHIRFGGGLSSQRVTKKKLVQEKPLRKKVRSFPCRRRPSTHHTAKGIAQEMLNVGKEKKKEK